MSDDYQLQNMAWSGDKRKRLRIHLNVLDDLKVALNKSGKRHTTSSRRVAAIAGQVVPPLTEAYRSEDGSALQRVLDDASRQLQALKGELDEEAARDADLHRDAELFVVEIEKTQNTLDTAEAFARPGLRTMSLWPSLVALRIARRN